jgi:hypothetical protein
MAEFAPPHFSNVLSAFCGFFINMAFTRKHWIPFKD